MRYEPRQLPDNGYLKTPNIFTHHILPTLTRNENLVLQHMAATASAHSATGTGDRYSEMLEYTLAATQLKKNPMMIARRSLVKLGHLQVISQGRYGRTTTWQVNLIPPGYMVEMVDGTRIKYPDGSNGTSIEYPSDGQEGTQNKYLLDPHGTQIKYALGTQNKYPSEDQKDADEDGLSSSASLQVTTSAGEVVLTQHLHSPTATARPLPPHPIAAHPAKAQPTITTPVKARPVKAPPVPPPHFPQPKLIRAENVSVPWSGLTLDQIRSCMNNPTQVLGVVSYGPSGTGETWAGLPPTPHNWWHGTGSDPMGFIPQSPTVEQLVGYRVCVLAAMSQASNTEFNFPNNTDVLREHPAGLIQAFLSAQRIYEARKFIAQENKRFAKLEGRTAIPYNAAMFRHKQIFTWSDSAQAKSAM